MRSVTFTLLLLVLAVTVTLVAALRLKDGNLEKLFGAPPVQIGKHLYKFDPLKAKPHRIQLGGNGFIVDCVYEHNVWTARCSRVTRGDAAKGDDKVVKEKLWEDRMDKRAADLLVQFTLGTQVVDVIPKGKLDTARAGLKEGIIGVKIEDEQGELLANYFLGHTTKWVYIDPKQPEPKIEQGEKWVEDKTVFIQPLDPGRGDDIYVGTGDIHSLFRDGFRHLRDHHPFFIDPLALESVRIKNGEDELVLSHAEPKAPWRLTKPLERKTNSAAVTKLLTDLFNLRAVQVKDRSEVTLPDESANGHQSFALKHFGLPKEMVLTIMPPASPEAETVYATVSDRPGTVFELRLKPLPTLPATPKATGAIVAPAPPKDDLVSLAEIPDTINELRDPMLTMIDPAALQGILIKPSTGPEILLSREQVGSDWYYQDTRGSTRQKANALTLARLVGAITTTKVDGFETDSASNLAPYGLDRPAISLTFVSFGSDRFELLFGQGGDGSWYAMRAGIPTVMNVGDDLIGEISTRLWQWRPPYPWSLSEANVKGIERKMSGKPDLLLEYSFTTQSWTTAREGLTDRKTELVTARADKLLSALINLQAEEWLAPDDPKALEALADPPLQFEITADEYDENAVLKGVEHRVLTLGPGSGPIGSQFYYGRVDKDSYPFRIPAKYAERLKVDLFSDD